MPKKMRSGKFRSYVVIAGLIQAAIFSIPFGVRNRPNLIYLFPLVGDATTFILPLCAALIGIASIAPWFITTAKAAKVTAICGMVGLPLCLAIYISVAITHIKTVPADAQNQSAIYTIGDTKSALAIETFGQNCEKKDELNELVVAGLSDDCDVAMIQAAGQGEESVRALWTPASLNKVHAELLLGYIGFLVCMNIFVGAAARTAQLRT